MKIIRDGKEIELTDDELFRAWQIKKHEFDREDVDYLLRIYLESENVESEEIEKTLNNDDLMDRITESYFDYLGNQDFGDLKWDCIADAYEKERDMLDI